MRVLIYNLAFLLFSVFYLPVFLIKLKQADDPLRLLRERSGVLPARCRKHFLEKKIIWLHAVSVGEVMAVEPFLAALLNSLPEYHFVLTTVTPTGQKLAKKLESKNVSVFYFPFDLTGPVCGFLDVLAPESILLAETELWPNLLTEASRRNIPVGVINARLSERSAQRYRKMVFFKPLFTSLSFVLAQTEKDAERFKLLGVQPSKIQVFGNMKFDRSGQVTENISHDELRIRYGFEPADLILIGGSTHPGEEIVLRDLYLSLIQDFPKLKLLIAPRHIERSEKVLELFRQKGLKTVLSSQFQQKREAFQVFILDQLGVLKSLYAIGDLVFVGGSLIRHGGQNPIEPAIYRKPVLHGPHIFNFQAIYQSFDQEGGGLLVQDGEALNLAVRRLLSDSQERKTLGEKAFSLVERMRGSTQRHTDWLSKFLTAKNQVERNDHVEVR